MVRRGIPLTGLLFLGGSVARYLLLCVFDLSLSIAMLGAAALMKHTLFDPAYAQLKWSERIDQWVTSMGAMGFIAVFLTCFFSMPLFILGVLAGESWKEIFMSESLWLSALVMFIVAMFNATEGASFEAEHYPSSGHQGHRRSSIEADERRRINQTLAPLALVEAIEHANLFFPKVILRKKTGEHHCRRYDLARWRRSYFFSGFLCSIFAHISANLNSFFVGLSSL